MVTPKATKENALKLISHYFNEVSDIEMQRVNKTYFNNDFYCFEQIAKGYAMLYICRDKRFNANQKQEMFKIIREM
jgi:sugar phosphate permease